MHFNALHLNNLYFAVLFEDFNTLIASSIGIITVSVATRTYSIHHFTCDITKIFQSPLPSLCILFHPSLAPPFSSSIAHYTIPRNLKTLLHITLYRELYRHCCILHYIASYTDPDAHYTIHLELSRHNSTFYNTTLTLKALQHVLQYPKNSQDPDAYYTIHHEQSKHCYTFRRSVFKQTEV